MAYSRRSLSRAAAVIGGALIFVVHPALARTASRAALLPPATLYSYEGIAYDRLFLSRLRSRAARTSMHVRSNLRTPSVAGAPYRFTDLSVPTGLYGTAFGVNDLGDIAYYYRDDYNYLLGDPEVVHDDGTYTPLGEPVVDPYGDAGAVAYALNATGDAVGVALGDCCGPLHHWHVDWTPSEYFIGTSFDGSYAYAVNDSNVSVGQALFAGIPAAAVFSISPQGGDRHPVMLLPPKNTTWIGTATGINEAGEIVGYAKERAVIFQRNAYAQVLPVGAAGVSTSAQAINVHGDIVGNAGGEAYLYRNHRLTYLPRPAGETAGNAVALAINASDEIVGDIVDPATGTSTAFLYVGGESYDLDSLLAANSSYSITQATGINDSGEIVGNANGNGFSLKPQSALVRSATFRKL